MALYCTVNLNNLDIFATSEYGEIVDLDDDGDVNTGLDDEYPEEEPLIGSLDTFTTHSKSDSINEEDGYDGAYLYNDDSDVNTGSGDEYPEEEPLIGSLDTFTTHSKSDTINDYDIEDYAGEGAQSASVWDYGAYAACFYGSWAGGASAIDAGDTCSKTHLGR